MPNGSDNYMHIVMQPIFRTFISQNWKSVPIEQH